MIPMSLCASCMTSNDSNLSFLSLSYFLVEGFGWTTNTMITKIPKEHSQQEAQVQLICLKR